MDITMKDDANWNSLPFEILHQIFRFSVKLEMPWHHSRLTLVCKNWLLPAQLTLYTDVTISSFIKLEKFYSTVEKNTHLGSLVKGIAFNLDLCQDQITISRILKSLLCTHLINLEELDGRTLEFYNITIHALLGSSLKKLKKLQGPDPDYTKNEVEDYVTCCLLLKDRLKDIVIAENSYFEETELDTERLLIDRFYNNLSQFDKLTSIFVNIDDSDGIQVLEYITQHCKFLKDIELNMKSSTNSSVWSDEIINVNPTTNVKTIKLHEEISNIIPATNVEILKIDEDISNDVLLYIIHKFPRLRILVMGTRYTCGNIDDKTVAKLVNYLSGVNYFVVPRFKVDINTITEYIGKAWNATSETGSKPVNFIFNKSSTLDTETSLELSKKAASSTTFTEFTFNAPDVDWGHINDFISKNGRFISKLCIANKYKNECYLSETFIQYITAYCPQLQHLHLQHCALKAITPQSNTDFSKQLSLGELYLERCTLFAGVLEHWSLYLPKIKKLHLERIDYRNENEQRPLDQPVLEIIMPFTSIDLIVLTGDYFIEEFFLKLFLPTQRVYFYQQNTALFPRLIFSSNVTEFMKRTNQKYIYVCCETKPAFHFLND